MELISDIINELVDSKKTITSPLLKTKVLASKLKNSELLIWVNNELNGYDPHGDTPEYRKCMCDISGTYINGYTQYNDLPLPTAGLPNEFEKSIKQMVFYDSVATLESLHQAELEVVLSVEVVAFIERNIQRMGNPQFQLLQAKKYTSVGTFVQILSVIRFKLLDFMLKLDEEFGNLIKFEELQQKNKQITIIMNNTIITKGDGNIVNTGDNSKIQTTISISKGDKETLVQKLSESGVAQEDSDELIKIIDTEIPDKKTDKFGSKVNDWIQKMIGKALNGGWQIGIGTAGNLLADLIKSYYGLKLMD